MPSKIQLDENLWFLYICLQNSDIKAIDFNAVGHHTNLKPPAARMRYTRLRRQIENGTLIGTHGTPFSSPSEKIAEAIKRRKRGNREPNTISKYKTSTSKPSQNLGGKGEDEEGNYGLRERKRRGKVLGGSMDEGKIKQETGRENGEGEEDAEFEEVSVSSSDQLTDADSEDEIPLAKRMRTKFQFQCPGTYQNNNNNYQSPYQPSSIQYPQLPQQQQKQQRSGNHSAPESGSGSGNLCVGVGVGMVGGAGTSFSQQDTPRYPNPSVVSNPQRQSQNQEQGSYNFGNHWFGNQEQYQRSQMTPRFREDNAHARDQKAGWNFGQGTYHGMGNGR